MSPSPPAISWIKLPPVASPAPEVAALQAASRERLGYVRTFLQVPFKPQHLAAIQAYIDLLVRGAEGVLPVRERELMALVVSVENRCEACVIAHATALEKATGDKALVDILLVNFRRAPLSPRERALALFAWKLTAAPAEADESYIEGLRAAGLREDEILEAAQIAALFNYTNRLNSVLGVAINPEAHAGFRRPS
jgi:uncharacterized peroxidase-related enzyme